MNDLITPLIDAPYAMGWFYFVRIFWVLFATLTLFNCQAQLRRVWSDFTWWSAAQNGLELEQKRVVAEGRFETGLWHTFAAMLLTVTGALAVVQVVWGQLPRPEVASQSAGITSVLLLFIFCFYRASLALGKIEGKLRKLEKVFPEQKAKEKRNHPYEES